MGAVGSLPEDARGPNAWAGSSDVAEHTLAGGDICRTPAPRFLEGSYHAWWLDLGYPRYVAPEVFKAAYRRVVDRVRARGATNVIWVFHFMNYSMPQEEWNLIVQSITPGSKYVDWLGMSVYGQQYVEDNWSPFEPLLDWPYTEITRIDPTSRSCWRNGASASSRNSAASPASSRKRSRDEESIRSSRPRSSGTSAGRTSRRKTQTALTRRKLQQPAGEFLPGSAGGLPEGRRRAVLAGPPYHRTLSAGWRMDGLVLATD